jgi:hypothetical protein
MRVSEMTPKQIYHYRGFQDRLQKIVKGSISAVKSKNAKVEYSDINYSNNPNNLIARVTIYSGIKIFAIITAYKKEGSYHIDYKPTVPKKNFTVGEAVVNEK